MLRPGMWWVKVELGREEKRGGRGDPTASVPLLAGADVCHTMFTQTSPPTSQRQRRVLNIESSGLFSEIVVGVLLTWTQESQLAKSRSLRVAPWKPQSSLLLLGFSYFFCSTENQSSRTGASCRNSGDLVLRSALISLLTDPRAL